MAACPELSSRKDLCAAVLLTLRGSAHERVAKQGCDIVNDEHTRRGVISCVRELVKEVGLKPKDSRDSQTVEDRFLVSACVIEQKLRRLTSAPRAVATALARAALNAPSVSTQCAVAPGSAISVRIVAFKAKSYGEQVSS